MIAAELKRMLTSPQSEFVEQFLSEGSPRHHWLSGPAGSGLSGRLTIKYQPSGRLES